ncbi:MAG: DUF1861 family protein [Nanoarchaeota archaeon]|nr:DUF1861 family protein [Nanoarchaeota archaeon]MBU1104015.1 DUF1861 family protein [Nanoarchaeota archaeon]
MARRHKKIKDLLGKYRRRSVQKVRKLKFEGIGGLDVYNVTAPFRVKQTQFILGRAEERNIETGTRVMFFRRQRHSRKWHVDPSCPVFDLQDPFIFEFEKLIVLGGVEIQQKSNKRGLSYRTVFFKGADIHNLRKFAVGPWGMKGVRFVLLPNKKIGVFTRPQGKRGRRGKIGFVILDSLKKLTPRTLSRAQILGGQFARGEWGGVDEIHFLKNGKLGVLGHIACFTRDKKRWYYPMTFVFDYEKRKFSGMKIIARRSEIPKGETKRGDLYNVLYPGGIIRNGDGKGIAKLYVGVSDAEAYEITLKDPFLEYEAEKKV